MSTVFQFKKIIKITKKKVKKSQKVGIDKKKIDRISKQANKCNRNHCFMSMGASPMKKLIIKQHTKSGLVRKEP